MVQTIGGDEKYRSALNIYKGTIAPLGILGLLISFVTL
jgi:hypothetical protein